MKRIVIVVEDNLEEVAKAKEAIAQIPDLRVVVTHNLQDFQRVFALLKDSLLGVITDLHFPANEQLADQTAANPNGLSVVAICVSNNIPVAVCSDINHHYCQHLEEPIKALSEHKNYQHKRIRFMADRKNWENALNELLT